MTNDGSFNPDWWRQAKAASLERKRRRATESSLAKPGDAFLIVTEGTVTEPVYIGLLVRDLQLSIVRIKVQPGDYSAPHQVILTAERIAAEQVRKAKKGRLAINEPGKFDQVWAVIDTDVAQREEKWNEVEQLARAKNVRLAHSTPCFEFWLLIHLVGFTTRTDLIDGDHAKAAVKEALGRAYSTNEEIARAVLPFFMDKWAEAVGFADQVRQHHHYVPNPPPANPSTDVDLLVRALNESAALHAQKNLRPRWGPS